MNVETQGGRVAIEAAPDLDQAASLAEITKYGRRAYERELASSTGGNISARTGSIVLVTATGASLGDLDSDTVIPVTLDGRPVADGRPSKELPAHLRIYQQCLGVRAIIHGHSAYAVAASTLLEVGDDALSAYSAGYLIRVRTLPLLPYLESGSDALADGVANAIAQSGHAVLLRNHGFFAVGASMAEAFNTADELLDALKVYMISGGRAAPLPDEARARILAKFAPVDRGAGLR